MKSPIGTRGTGCRWREAQGQGLNLNALEGIIHPYKISMMTERLGKKEIRFYFSIPMPFVLCEMYPVFMFM